MPENTNRQLYTDLSMVGEILKFQMKQEVNNHGMCILEGIVADGCKDNFVKENNSEKRVTITLENIGGDGQKKVIFVGIIGELSIYQYGGIYQFKMKLYSLTFLMDMEKKSRSFQNADMTYEELIKKIAGEYEGGDILDSLSKGKKLEKLFVQYQETDWEFLKRLASHFHGSLLAACDFSSPKVFFGARKEIHIGNLEQYAYSLEKQILQYRTYSANGYEDYMESDAARFTIDDQEYYEIGSGVTYQNTSLSIGGVEGEMKMGEIMFHYQLRTAKGMGQQTIYAEQLVGVSILAEVLESVRDRIKVQLDIDDVQDKHTAWEFPYQTMYTAEGEGGWYCMPEKGDKVMIYFPGNQEISAVGMTSSRQTDTTEDKTGEPEIKFFRTIYGKEIRFTPEAVEIICEDSSNGRTRAKIILHQDDGIEVYSHAGITFNSKKGIRLEAEEEVEITASEQIKLHCKKSKIQMDTMVDIAGPDVRIN